MPPKAPSFETQELREFGEVLKGRRTINLYLHTPVPRQLVLDAVEAATWAPNHHVTEPWRFLLMGEKTVARVVELVREMVTETKGPELGAFKARSWAEKPGWLTVTCQRSDDELREREDSSYEELARIRCNKEGFRERRIFVEVKLTREEAIYVIRDEGSGFDHSGLDDPRDATNLERPSGRGVMLMKTFMDEVHYNEAGNEVTLIKRSDVEPPSDDED